MPVSPSSSAVDGPSYEPVAVLPNDAATVAERSQAAPEPRELDEATRLSPPPVAVAQAPADAGTAEVFSSYYGPGLYGHGTACGLVLTTGLLGVAHRSLPCGTPVTLQHGSTTVTVPVVDRGPYVLSREFDLTYATKVALGCPDLCRVAWVR